MSTMSRPCTGSWWSGPSSEGIGQAAACRIYCIYVARYGGRPGQSEAVHCTITTCLPAPERGLLFGRSVKSTSSCLTQPRAQSPPFHTPVECTCEPVAC